MTADVWLKCVQKTHCTATTEAVCEDNACERIDQSSGCEARFLKKQCLDVLDLYLETAW